MKDLKHLIAFEDLLQEANNALVRQAKEEGRLAIGYTCFHMPEVLLNLGSCFSVRMRAPRTGSLEIATYYMSNYTCEYGRALLERAVEGGYNFLSAIAGVDACAQMNRAMENIELPKLIPGEKFFISHADIPYKVTPWAIEHYVTQIRTKVLEPLHEKFGVDISEDAMRKAVAEHNEVCRILTEIGEYRKEENPRITGYEYHILNLVSYTCPKYLILDQLRETLEELKTREPNEKKQFRAKVVMIGSEIDDPDFTRLVEESGALIVADRYCFGSFPGRQELTLTEGEDVLTSICRQYLEASQCARYMSHEKIQDRRDFARKLYHDFHADGIIYEQLKFCDYWGYERALVSHIMQEEYDLPVLSIDRPYMVGSSGQIRTRIQAFVERLEIKQIQKERGGTVRG